MSGNRYPISQELAARRFVERLGGESQAQEFLARQEKLRAQKQTRISELQADKVFPRKAIPKRYIAFS
jgi:hypothetical protein